MHCITCRPEQMHDHLSCHKQNPVQSYCCPCSYNCMQAVDEIRTKQREDYNRLTVLSDTLAFEPDRP